MLWRSFERANAAHTGGFAVEDSEGQPCVGHLGKA